MPNRGLDAGGDGTIGEVGESASRVALGKDIQQMIVALGESGERVDNDALSKVLRIVLGDGVKWNGVMQELERLGESVKSLTDKMIALEEKLTTKVTTLEKTVNLLQSEMHERRETSAEMLWMMRVILGVVTVLAIAYLRQWFGG